MFCFLVRQVHRIHRRVRRIRRQAPSTLLAHRSTPRRARPTRHRRGQRIRRRTGILITFKDCHSLSWDRDSLNFPPPLPIYIYI
jgi:hypothetical protein